MVRAFTRQRLGEFGRTIGGPAWLVGDGLMIADPMTSSVPKIAAWQERVLDRPSYRKAMEEERATFAALGLRDMRTPRDRIKARRVPRVPEGRTDADEVIDDRTDVAAGDGGG